jgi:hypothetical protein
MPYLSVTQSYLTKHPTRDEHEASQLASWLASRRAPRRVHTYVCYVEIAFPWLSNVDFHVTMKTPPTCQPHRCRNIIVVPTSPFCHPSSQPPRSVPRSTTVRSPPNQSSYGLPPHRFAISPFCPPFCRPSYVLHFVQQQLWHRTENSRPNSTYLCK